MLTISTHRLLPAPLTAPEVINYSYLAADPILVMIHYRHTASVDIEHALRRGAATRAVGALCVVLSCPVQVREACE